MDDQKKKERALATFSTLCEMLEERDWKYQKTDEYLTITSGIRGEDLPIEFSISIIEKDSIIILKSTLPFKMNENKRIDGAIATSIANFRLNDGNDGSFDYDYETGTIIFRMTASFKDCCVGKEIFEYLIFLSAAIIDDYNDKLLMLSKGVFDISEYKEKTGRNSRYNDNN